MALSAGERAILELVHERGLSYEEIDDLLGGEPGEARRRADAALEALDLQEAAELPSVPRRSAAERRWRRARLAAGVLAAVGIGLGAGALVTGGSGESIQTAASETGNPAAADGVPEPVSVTLAATEAQDEARGEAVIGLDDRYRPFLDLDLEGVPPAPRGSIYVPWVDLEADRGVPIPVPISVQDGAFQGRVDLAPQLISVLDIGRELELVALDRTELRELSRHLQGGGRSGSGALQRPGEAVLSGRIPSR